MFGAGGGTSAYREAEETDLIVLWGSNARETHPIFFHHVLKGKRRGARMYAIDPRRTSSAAFADVWLGLEVGSDVALSNTIAREIIAAGLTNPEFIARATSGFEAYKASVEPYTLARGEELTGVKADVIQELAHSLARADRAQLCWTLGITEHHNAVDNVLGIINLFWCLRWIDVFAATSPYDTDYAAVRHSILRLMIISSLIVVILYFIADRLIFEWRSTPRFRQPGSPRSSPNTMSASWSRPKASPKAFPIPTG